MSLRADEVIRSWKGFVVDATNGGVVVGLTLDRGKEQGGVGEGGGGGRRWEAIGPGDSISWEW